MSRRRYGRDTQHAVESQTNTSVMELALTARLFCMQNLPHGVRMHILLVFDGWNKMSASMKRWIPASEPQAERRLKRLSHNLPLHADPVIVKVKLYISGTCLFMERPLAQLFWWVVCRYMARLYPGSEAEQQKAVDRAKSSPREGHVPRYETLSFERGVQNRLCRGVNIVMYAPLQHTRPLSVMHLLGNAQLDGRD